MIFNSYELNAIAEWMATAKPLKGTYYRSVEYRYMDPQEVLSGRGAALYGGRFASVGTRAVFLAASDSEASRQVLARKRRLGGAAQITLDRYPRIVFGISVSPGAGVGPLQNAIPQNTGSRPAEMPRPGRSHPVDGIGRPIARDRFKGSSFAAPRAVART